MRSTTRFIAVLLSGLGILSVLGYAALWRTTRGWFEADLALRSGLAIRAASQSLRAHWEGNRAALAGVLADITRDERILGAYACSLDGETLAATDGYPSLFSCRSLLDRMRAEAPHARSWSMTPELPSGPVQLSVNLLGGESHPFGAVVLVHDLSYLSRREGTTQELLLGAFFILSLGAAGMTLLAARFARRGWALDLERALAHGGGGELAPLVKRVRALAERMSREREVDIKAGPWSPTRLHETLRAHLHGERIVVLSNREPYVHDQRPDGIHVMNPASGLVTALEPVMRACSGVWVAHGSGSGDRATVDARDHVLVPPGEDAYSLRRVWLSEAEENGYYYGFANEGLWPLCHVAHTRPAFRAEDWEYYASVNRRFAEAVCEEVDADDPIILVQDYHFALAPKMIRKRLPRATIITFWHIPWPNAERIGICPWREQLLSGLLGSSIVGFHTQQHCNNFIDSVDAFMESRIDREHGAIVQGKRRTLVRSYPISIEWPVHWLRSAPSVEDARSSVRRELGLPDDALIGVGIDRLDYTKGIEERLAAVSDLFERYPEFRGKFSFVQLAAPSRTKILQYRELNERVEALAAEINSRYGTDSYRPVILLRKHHEKTDVFRFYRAAELCYVSSLHDGMNLVAKEFAAARDDLQGVLVLSQFTGAARDLTEALLVNPYHIRQAADALATALKMPKSEQRARMESMRRMVAEFNVYRWAGRMLIDAAELRRKERLWGRLSHPMGLGHEEHV
jgi:trehalose 6-phosphate synthase